MARVFFQGHLVKHGLVLGEIQDWAEQALHDQKGFPERLANHLGPERASPLHLCEPCAAGLERNQTPVPTWSIKAGPLRVRLHRPSPGRFASIPSVRTKTSKCEMPNIVHRFIVS